MDFSPSKYLQRLKLNSNFPGVAAIGLLSIYFLLLAPFDLELVKITFLRLFVSEWVAVLAIFLFFYDKPRVFFNSIKKIWPFFVFSLWCLAIHGWSDFRLILEDSELFQRFLRHSVLFIYPSLWILIGYIFRKKSSGEFVHWLLLAFCMLQIYPGLQDRLHFNLAMGPLAAFLLPLILFYPLSPRATKIQFAVIWGMRAYVFFAFLIPFQSGTCVSQRTTFVNVIWGMGLGGFMVARLRKFSLARSLLVGVSFSLVIVVTGLIFSNRFANKYVEIFVPDRQGQKKEMILNDLGVKIFAGLQHGDDVSVDGSSVSLFESRFRKSLWHRAYMDWIDTPFVGLGFTVEVPSYVFNLPNHKSSNERKGYSHLPISGPHNSYLNLLVRTGLIGLLLWLGLGIIWGIRVLPLISPKESIGVLVAIVAVGNFVTYSLLHLGLESPQYAIPFYFLLGILYCHALIRREESNGSEK